MSCYYTATAVATTQGYTGKLHLKIKISAPAGFVPPILKKGNLPHNPKNVFPVIIEHAVPAGATTSELELHHDLNDINEFTAVEIFCNKTDKPGSRFLIKIEKSVKS